MPLVKTSKEEIVQTALGVFRKNGYYNTSMSDLAVACGLQKGSFYHYFDSKELLMAEVLTVVYQNLKEKIFVIAEDESLSPRDRLEKLLVKLGKALLMQDGGCIVGNTILETSNQNLSFKNTLKAIMEDWKAALVKILTSEYSEGTAGRMADQMVMEFEGAVMMSQLYENDQYLKDVFVRSLTKLH